MVERREQGPLRRLLDRELFTEFLRKRIAVLALVFAIEAALFFLVANVPFLPGEQARYSQSINATRNAVSGLPIPNQIGTIFWNNEQIAVQDLSPLQGPIYFLLTSYNTARGIEVLALMAGATSNSVLLQLYSLPHTWIETSAYALGITEAVYIIGTVLRRKTPDFDWDRLERELRYVPPVMVMVVALLTVAAVFEVLEAHTGGNAEFLFWVPTVLLAILAARAVMRRPVAQVPAVPAASAAAVEPAPPGFEGLRRDVESRTRDDRPTSAAWLALPAGELILEYSVIVYAFYALYLIIKPTLAGNPPPTVLQLVPFGEPLYTVLTYMAFAGLMVFLYRLIQGRNQHFAREHAFLEDLLRQSTARAAQVGKLDEFQARLVPARQTLDEIRKKEGRRDPLLWTVSTFFIGILILFDYYFLSKDFFRHEEREDRFLDQLAFAASAIGVNLRTQRRARPLPNRSFALYAILSAVTAYTFWFYWNYRLIQDQNQHFNSEWELEDGLLTAVRGDATQT